MPSCTTRRSICARSRGGIAVSHRAVRARRRAFVVATVLAGAAVALPVARGARAQVGHDRSSGAQREYARSSAASVPPKARCGRAAPETLAQTVGWVAKQIYYGEVSSSETFKDRRQVESYAPLLRAVAGDEKAAAGAAVTSLVYSHTHIVRLRVSRSSKLLADVGGPYVLAPLSGTLRLHGRVVGHYLLSVQDDVGYVKIETHFIGAPLVLRIGAKSVPLEGLSRPDQPRSPHTGRSPTGT